MESPRIEALPQGLPEVFFGGAEVLRACVEQNRHMCRSICSIFQQNRGTRYLIEGLNTSGRLFFARPTQLMGRRGRASRFRRWGEEPVSSQLWVAVPPRPAARRRDLARPNHLRRRRPLLSLAASDDHLSRPRRAASRSAHCSYVAPWCFHHRLTTRNPIASMLQLFSARNRLAAGRSASQMSDPRLG